MVEVKNMRAFLIGALGYPALELMWRGRTHYSMALAGGASAACFQRISRTALPQAAKAALGGGAVTAIEGLCGAVWNQKHRVWDYRRMPLNWHGQVCLPYSILWCALADAWMRLDKAGRKA